MVQSGAVSFPYLPSAMNLSLEASILKHFCDLEDPRIERTKQHLLGDIIAIAILAVNAYIFHAA